MQRAPLIIIGAGRSGTNILRDSICSLRGYETWPCDEINYIWRHGNIRKKHDRFTEEDYSPTIAEFIQNEFNKLYQKTNADSVVEKTCANSLRIPFIHKIFPDAKYVFIQRNGYDVAASARKRWTASLDIKYILEKARFVPIQDMPYYASRYLINRVKKLVSSENRLAYWGPVYPGMLQDLSKNSLIEICAMQWAACVKTAYKDLLELPQEQVYYLKYENFVRQAESSMQGIMEFLDTEKSKANIRDAISEVSSRSIGNYKKNLTKTEIELIEPIVEPIMESVYEKVT
jgi:hypothetical protein